MADPNLPGVWYS